MELSGRPRDPSGVLQGPFGEHFGPFLDDFGVSFARAVVARIYLYFGRSPNLFLRFFPDFLKMAEIAPDW